MQADAPVRRRMPQRARTPEQARAAQAARWKPENRVASALRVLASDDPAYVAAVERAAARCPEFSERVANRLRAVLAPAAAKVAGAE